MRHVRLILKSIVVLIAVVTLYVILGWLFGAHEFNTELQKEAEANSPECNFPKGQALQVGHTYLAKEVDEQAARSMACINAKIKYINSKQ